MTLGLAERQGDLLDDVVRFCDDVVAPGSVYALLHRERDRLFPDEFFADLFSDRGRRSVPPSVVATVMVLQRLEGAVAAEIRSAAAERPTDADAQLAVADLDLSGGHVEDAFGRLLDVFPSLDADGRGAGRQRLLDYFEIVGAEDPRTIAARRRLTALLY